MIILPLLCADKVRNRIYGPEFAGALENSCRFKYVQALFLFHISYAHT